MTAVICLLRRMLRRVRLVSSRHRCKLWDSIILRGLNQASTLAGVWRRRGPLPICDGFWSSWSGGVIASRLCLRRAHRRAGGVRATCRWRRRAREALYRHGAFCPWRKMRADCGLLQLLDDRAHAIPMFRQRVSSG